jgi:hypothetical protein
VTRWLGTTIVLLYDTKGDVTAIILCSQQYILLFLLLCDWFIRKLIHRAQ